MKPSSFGHFPFFEDVPRLQLAAGASEQDRDLAIRANAAGGGDGTGVLGLDTILN